MPNTNSNLLNHPIFWRFLGVASSIVGFSCYALSPTFKYMFGEWKWWKILIYTVLSSIYSCFMILVKDLGLQKNFILKANVSLLVFLGTCIYSFFQDKSEGGKSESDYGRMLSLFSFGGFSLMSLSLSRQTNIGFEMGVSCFFLSSFFLCAMKFNIKVAMGAALICCVVVFIRCYSDSMLEKEGDDIAHQSGEEDGTSLNDTGSIAENSHSNLDSQSDSMFQMQADDRAHVIININRLSQTDAAGIAEDFQSYLYSQLELPRHVSINTNTLVEITARGDRGNQETEAGNPHVDYGLSSHVNSEVFPLVDSSVNDDRNEDISQIDGHDRHQVFPQVEIFISYEGDRSLISMFLAELERKNIKVHQGNDENEEGSSGGSLGVDSMIEGSVAAVIIFSEKYPFSVERLKELVKIIECKRRHGLIVIPIFLDIHPNEVHDLKGSYASHFRDCEFDYGIEQVDSWRNALREASDSESENLIILHRKRYSKLIADYQLREKNRKGNGQNHSRGKIRSRIFQSIMRSSGAFSKAKMD